MRSIMDWNCARSDEENPQNRMAPKRPWAARPSSKIGSETTYYFMDAGGKLLERDGNIGFCKLPELYNLCRRVKLRVVREEHQHVKLHLSQLPTLAGRLCAGGVCRFQKADMFKKLQVAMPSIIVLFRTIITRNSNAVKCRSCEQKGYSGGGARRRGPSRWVR